MLGSYVLPALTLTIYDTYLDGPALRNANKVTRLLAPFRVPDNTHSERDGQEEGGCAIFFAGREEYMRTDLLCTFFPLRILRRGPH